MNASAQTFRIFVSSTFSDLKLERNALQAYVFPRLRELCESHNARFQPIDLRWGVSTEASLDQQAMSICLSEVARCQKISPRPNFIVLLGDRYGWMPPPSQIPEDDFQALLRAVVADQDRSLLDMWYTLDENAVPAERRLNPRKKGGPYERYEDWQPVETALQRILSQAVERLDWQPERKLGYQASATHQEILNGALKQTDAPEHVFCFFRDIRNLPRNFNMPGFREILTTRLNQEYPHGISPECADLVGLTQALPDQAQPAEIRDQITKNLQQVPQGSLERNLLDFMLQVLSDYIGKDFINLNEEDLSFDEDAHQKLTNLKIVLKARFAVNYFAAEQVDWLGGSLPSAKDPYKLISSDHIGTLPDNLAACMPLLDENHPSKNLCEALFQCLGRVILAELDHPHPVVKIKDELRHIKPVDHLDLEGLAHHAFAEDRLTFFIGRQTILREIEAYISNPDQHSLVIFGEGGAGKSALIAKAIDQTQRILPNARLAYRFIGVTPGSSDGRSLLSSLCGEISRAYGVSEEGIPIDFRDLVPEFSKRLTLASVEKPLVLFLDSLDQLSDAHGARGLSWLPNQLPEGVAMILSSRHEVDLVSGLKPKSTIEKQLGGLPVEDGAHLLNEWLRDTHRVLQDGQRQEVLDKFIASNGNPLYLKLAFEEARLWTSFQESQKALAVGVAGIIHDNMLQRLTDEGNHGRLLVSNALAYLAASRFGLAEDELVDLLSRDLEVYEWFFRQTYHLPSDLVHLAMEYLEAHPEALQNFPKDAYHDAERLALAWLKQDRTPPEPVMVFLKAALSRPDGPRLPIVLWSRLSFDLAPYLSERLVDGSTLLSFYHRELGDVSEAEFLATAQAPQVHRKLADYFRIKADPEGKKYWDGGYIHGLSELPYHLISAGERDLVFELLTDFKFLEHKAEEVGITHRKGQYGRDEITSEGVQDLQKDYEFALNTFYGGSGGGISAAPLIRTAEESGGLLRVYCPVCDHKSLITEDQLGEVIICPQEKCHASLKLNLFTIKMD